MCFRQNRIIRSEYVSSSGGNLRLFFRKAGTTVEQRQGDCGYTTGTDEIVVQLEGAPGFDSGYCAHYFPATMAGLKAAHSAMNEC